jgi:uncharacterized protein (DUF488 family)
MIRQKNYIMNFNLQIEHLGKKENKNDTEKDMYHLTFKTYNAMITGKFERSEIRHMIQILDNSII